MSETTAQRNARYQREFRARHGEVVARQRVTKRIAMGGVPRGPTLAKYNLTPDAVNAIRKEHDLPPLDLSKFPTICRKPETCVQVPVEKPRAPTASKSTTATQTKSTRSIATQTETPTETPSETPTETPPTSSGPSPKKNPGKGMTIATLADKIKGLVGEPRLKPNGDVARKDGKVLTLSEKTVDDYVSKLDFIARLIACSGDKDFAGCLRDYKSVIPKLRANWSNVNSLKAQFNVIVAAAKYIPEFKEGLGDAFDVYRGDMMIELKKSEKKTVEDTDTKTVTAIKTIRDKAKVVAKKFGDSSIEALATHLQSHLIGLRDNLSGVRVVKSAAEAKRGGIPNYYVPRSKKLVITKFKTSNHFPAYDLKIADSIAKRIATSLKENPRDFLIREKGVGDYVKRTFAKVGLDGIGVNEIRHSQISSMLRANPGAAAVARVASQFKHSPEMTLKYYRGEKVVGDE